MTTLDQLVGREEAPPALRLSWKHVFGGASLAGLISGLRIYVTYSAVGIHVSFADSIASGLMDWWLWMPFVPLVFRLARRFEPAHARPTQVVGVHLTAGLLIGFGQLALFSAASGLVRTVRFGDSFRVDLTSPLVSSLAPGFIAYLGLVVLAWWIAGRRETAREMGAVGRDAAPAHGPADPGGTLPSERCLPKKNKELEPGYSAAKLGEAAPGQVAEAPPEIAVAPIERTPLTFRCGKERVLLQPTEIDWVSAAGNYLELHVATRTYLARETMKSVHERLGVERFVRVHRSSLVRRDAIVALRATRQGAYVELRDGTRVPVGRRYRDELSEFVP